MKFSKEVTAYGRNGKMRCVGVHIKFNNILTEKWYNGIKGYDSTHSVDLRPINTRGIGNARITIPIEDLDKFIEILENIRDRIENSG